MIRMPNAAARRATSWPMRPRPARPERLVAHFLAEELLLLPLALLHRGVGGGQVPGQRQHQAHRQLRDADAVGARRVHDDDAARAGGGDVDVVDAGAGAGDHPQAWRGGDQGGGDFGGAADDERVGVGEIGGEWVGRAAGAGVDVPAFGAQEIERGGGKIVGDNNFHGVRRL